MASERDEHEDREDAFEDIYECRKCGSKRVFNDERVTCYGTVENPHKHDPVDVVYPCGACGDPITTGEICQDCADKSDVDAFTHPSEAWDKLTSGSS